MSFSGQSTANRSPIRRAKTIGETDIRRIAFEVQHDEHGLRNLVAFYLSFYCALRACEIARLRWDRNVLDASGEVAKVLRISGDVAKRGNGGDMGVPTQLRQALSMLREQRPRDLYVFYPLDARNDRRPTEKHTPLKSDSVVKFFKRLYLKYGYEGLTSHSGRRSAITEFSRKSAKTGRHSTLDTMNFARHRDPKTTMMYIEPNPDTGEIIENLWSQNTKGASVAKVARHAQRKSMESA